MSEISKRLEKVDKFLQKGKPSSALDELRAVISEDPTNDQARQRAADLCLSLNQTAEAAAYLGDMYDRFASQNRVGDAINAYKKLIRLGPASTERAFRYAQLVEKSNPREALEAYNNCFLSFVGRGDKSHAMAALKRMVTLDPSYDNYRREAELAVSMGDNSSAALAYLELGRVEESNGRNGLDLFGRAYTLNPENAPAAMSYARSLLRENDADKAVDVLQNLTLTTPEYLELFVNALLAAKRFAAAEAAVLKLYAAVETSLPIVGELLAAYVQEGKGDQAAEFARSVEAKVRARGALREFLTIVKDISDKFNPGTAFLEYLAQLYNASNREHDYCDTLLKLFSLHYAEHNFLKAADCLDRASEVDAYEPGHRERLEMLRGKVDSNRINSISARLASVVNMNTDDDDEDAPLDLAPTPSQSHEGDNQPTVLEDLMLQAEIFLQYSMRSKALERLERINKLFPGEEEKREKLAELFAAAGFTPKYDTPRSAPTSTAPADESAVDNLARVSEITRNISRQSNMKGVLFAAVNDVGRHWNVSRCVAGLSAPGKAPTAAMEYCAPGIPKSEVIGIARLISTLQAQVIQAGGPVSFEQAQRAAQLDAIRPVLAAQKIQSLVAVPLMDGQEHVGIIILEQCVVPRAFRKVDEVVLSTIAEQIVMAVNNARLRSLVKNLAVTDEKSGLLRRASYLDVLISEVQRGLPQKTPVTLALLNFGSSSALTKEVGETAVETAMQEVGQAVLANIRQNDTAIHYGQCSIAIILSDTNERSAVPAIEKLRKTASSIRLGTRTEPLVLSAGIAELHLQPKYDAVDIVTEAINRVESALEVARQEGGRVHALQPILEDIPA